LPCILAFLPDQRDQAPKMINAASLGVHKSPANTSLVYVASCRFDNWRPVSCRANFQNWRVLTVYIRVKVQMDLQVDKSSVVVKGPFFPRVMNPRYWIRGTNVWCKSWSIKAEKLRSSRGETYASNLKEHHKNESNLLKTGASKR
jgi:hypothetical protein